MVSIIMPCPLLMDNKKCGHGLLKETRPRLPEPRPNSGMIPSTITTEWISVGEEVPLPRPRIQLVHGTVPQKCACNTLPARSGILYRPAIEGLRCRRLPTSSTRAPRGDTQLMWLRLRSTSSVPTMLTIRSAPAAHLSPVRAGQQQSFEVLYR